MKFKNIILIALVILSAVSCNDDEVFEKEQYKNVFAFVTATDNSDNILTKYFDLTDDESIGYISFSMGGTNPTDQDLTINIVEDKSFIDAYNNSNYDMDIDKYIQPLNVSRYEIESMKCVIPAGAIGGQIPVKIRPVGLSPDSTYFISVRVDNYDNYEANPEKSNLLYRVAIKNYWTPLTSGNKLDNNYSLRAFKREKGDVYVMNIPGYKYVEPISGNAVRIIVGNEEYKKEEMILNRDCIILEMDENNNVTIKPYKDANVTQVNGDVDFPNTFQIFDDGYYLYRVFLLRYDYVAPNGRLYEMQEELRLKFSTEEEKEYRSLNN